MIVLGIETSCDETAVAVVDGGGVRSSAVYSQIREHRPFGGVVPEVASRAHVEKIEPVFREALRIAEVEPEQIDLVAATAGPGLIGALAVGFSFGRGLALSLQRPFMGIHHIEGHLFANRLNGKSPRPPFLALIISGGHTELVDVEDWCSYRLWARTRDDAAGEAFDKIGKMLGLEYPAGARVAELALGGDRQFLRLPVALRGQKDFSFSGLKTAAVYEVKKHPAFWMTENLGHICASVQEAIVDALVEKSLAAMEVLHRDRLVLAGGVACNKRLREKLSEAAAAKGFFFEAPAPAFCTDNAAMIAAAARYRHLTMPEAMGYASIFPSGEWYSSEGPEGHRGRASDHK